MLLAVHRKSPREVTGLVPGRRVKVLTVRDLKQRLVAPLPKAEVREAEARAQRWAAFLADPSAWLDQRAAKQACRPFQAPLIPPPPSPCRLHGLQVALSWKPSPFRLRSRVRLPLILEIFDISTN